MKRTIVLVLSFTLLPGLLLPGAIFFKPSIFYHGGTNFSAFVSQSRGYVAVNVPLRFPLFPTDLVLSIAGVDPEDHLMVKSMIFVESSMNVHAYSHTGAAGLMQLMPETARMLGVANRFDPFQNVRGGYEYLKKLKSRFGNWNEAIAAYHFGPGNVARYGVIGAGKIYLEKVKYTEERIKKGELKVGLVHDTAWLSVRGGFNRGSASLEAALIAQPFGTITLGLNMGMDLSSDSLGIIGFGLGLSLSEDAGVLGCVDLISKEAGVISWVKLWGVDLKAGWDGGPVLDAEYRTRSFEVSGGFHGETVGLGIGARYGNMWIRGGWKGEVYLQLDVGY